jgi:hypothetical protein
MADAALFKKLYRIFSWVTLASLLLTIGLVLRTSPPPKIPNDPKAAARAEQKFEAADATRASGLPAQVQLDRTELNSYLAQNLQMQSPAPGAPSSSPSPGMNRTGNAAPASDPTAGIGGSAPPRINAGLPPKRQKSRRDAGATKGAPPLQLSFARVPMSQAGSPLRIQSLALDVHSG